MKLTIYDLCPQVLAGALARGLGVSILAYVEENMSDPADVIEPGFAPRDEIGNRVTLIRREQKIIARVPERDHGQVTGTDRAGVPPVMTRNQLTRFRA